MIRGFFFFEQQIFKKFDFITLLLLFGLYNIL